MFTRADAVAITPLTPVWFCCWRRCYCRVIGIQKRQSLRITSAQGIETAFSTILWQRSMQHSPIRPHDRHLVTRIALQHFIRINVRQ
jgi:hypothetical protein